MIDSDAKQSKTIDNKVSIAITVAVAFSITLILSGIWNAQKTAEIAEASIKTSLEVQQLSNALRIHQDAMSSAVENAISTGDTHWRASYDNNFLSLQEAILNSASQVSDPIVDTIRNKLNDVASLERRLFKLLSEDDSLAAFSVFASDQYQEHKVEQEQLALTLRAILDRKASDVIAKLNQRLDQTTVALILQVILIITIWFYIIAIVKRWQRSQHQHSTELTRLAHYDSLTGIGNRALFHIRLDAAFEQSRRSNKSVGLLLMDIDHFKDINDNLGHDIGDELLIKVAEEVKRTCRESDTVARLGGDEFAVIISELEDKADSSILGNKILSIFTDPIRIKRHEIKTGTSIGLAFYPGDASSSEELLRKADMALYEAKRNGRANFKFFDLAIETSAREKVAIQDDLRTALKENQFELRYQPLIDLATNTITGVECLIRWHHPVRGFVSPNEFIAIAEESRLIVPIGEWVLREACEQQIAWQQWLPPLNIAVNLSGVQFNEANLLSMVESVLSDTGIQRDHLTLEITESTLMETEGDVIAKLHSLNALGLNLAIDDFGTGYSSLAYLKRFPIHHLKIDREFVKDLPANNHDVAISRSIIKMAHELGITVVAEGVENRDQMQFLHEADCNFAQGYYFGKPMTADELIKWFAATQGQYTSNVHRLRN